MPHVGLVKCYRYPLFLSLYSQSADTIGFFFRQNGLFQSETRTHLDEINLPGVKERREQFRSVYIDVRRPLNGAKACDLQ